LSCSVQFSVSTAGAFRKGVESNREVFLVVVVACDCVEGKGSRVMWGRREGEEGRRGGPLRTGGFSLEI